MSANLTLITPAQHKRILGFFGKSSMKGAARALGISRDIIRAIWKDAHPGYNPKTYGMQFSGNANGQKLSRRQQIVLDCVSEADERGVTREEIAARLIANGFSASPRAVQSYISHINYKAKLNDDDHRIVRITTPPETSRYALRQVAPRKPAVSLPQSPTHGYPITTGLYGVSLRRVTWLDGVAA